MVELDTPSPIKPEILTMRQWIVEDVIDTGFCPPLVKLAQPYKDEEREINWDEFGKEVVLVSYTDFNPQSPNLLQKVTDEYINFIRQSTYDSKAPYTKLFILPYFPDNAEYEAFMEKMANLAVDSLVSDTNRGLLRRAYKQIPLAHPELEASVQALLALPEIKESKLVMADRVVQGAYHPVFFYGNPLSDQETQSWDNKRGPIDRQKILSRAPYYAFQVVNRPRSPELIGHLDRPAVHRRNTEIVGTPGALKVYERKMKAYGGKN